MESLLHIQKLSHGSGGRARLRNIDLRLDVGDRLALLGSNGAGKSTLLQILSGALSPSSGDVLIRGEQLHQANSTARARIGYLPQRIAMYPDLNVRENLAWAARLRSMHGTSLETAIDRALEQVQLQEIAKRLASRLSAGMLQRLGLAQAIVHQPDILLLDEPTASLDPLQTSQIRDLIRTLDSNTAVVLATHLLEDVQQLCNRVVVLDAGRKTAEHEVSPDIDLLAHFHPKEQTA